MAKTRAGSSKQLAGIIQFCWLAALASLFWLMASCHSSETKTTSMYTSVLALIPSQIGDAASPTHPLVLEVGGDRWSALYQHPPSSVAIAPLPRGESCELRFALGIKDDVWDKSDGVSFRIVIRKDGQESTVFEEFLDASTELARWRERVVDLGRLARDSDSALILETEPGPEGDGSFDQAGWGAPHIVCEEPKLEERVAGRPNVILISIDTLRADHLGVYGYEGTTSPTLDELASSSLVFTNAFAPAPWTLPSHASMFTGRLPYEHGAGHRDVYEPLSSEHPTLATVLREAGYRTVGFSAGGFAGQRFGLARGFDRWVERPRANLRSVMPEVLDAIGANAEASFFLFLHTFDVHGPYLAWEEEAPTARPSRAASLPATEWRRIESIDYHSYHGLDRFQGLGEVIAAYDGGIRHVDAQLKRLLLYLRELSLYDDTLLIVTSDHGESLYEDHLYIGHSYTVSDREIRVPLIIRLPGGSHAGRTPELVSLVDLAPLVLDVVGIQEKPPMSGSNPLSRLEGVLDRRPHVQGEAVHTGVRFVRSRKWKVITEALPVGDPRSQLPRSLGDRFEGSPRALALEGDGSEAVVFGVRGATAEALAGLPDLWDLARSAPEPGTDLGSSPPALDDAQIEELRALGYIR